jgi:hypothetical protein
VICILPVISFAQYPIVEEFDSFGGAGEWTVDNGGGVQNYGGAENYGTFNIGTTPYLNNTTHTIESIVYDFSDCSSDITISFPMSGYVETGQDVMNFEYYDGGAWVTDLTVTGIVNGTYTNTAVPNTTTQFRFQLITDAPNPVYFKTNYSAYSLTLGGQFTVPVDLSTQYIGGAPKTIQTYYYDIPRFTIDCATPLPIELIDFNVMEHKGTAVLNWITASEINNDYFNIYWSEDGINWLDVHRENGAGNSTQILNYYAMHKNLKEYNYYKLKQTDFNGHFEYSKVIVLHIPNIDDYEYEYFNVIGQPVPESYQGFKLKQLK